MNKFDSRVSVIPNGLEKYMSFTLNGNIVFIDSVLFSNSPVDKLVKNLSDKDFEYLSEVFSDEELELVKQKGVYPYEYFNSFKRFEESKLPDIDQFFSSLKDCGISEKEYQRACDVWKVFGFKNLGQHHDSKDYGLDLSHYFSSPGLSWDAILKIRGIQLEKVSNIDVHLFLEKGMRGGVSYISKR